MVHGQRLSGKALQNHKPRQSQLVVGRHPAHPYLAVDLTVALVGKGRQERALDGRPLGRRRRPRSAGSCGLHCAVCRLRPPPIHLSASQDHLPVERQLQGEAVSHALTFPKLMSRDIAVTGHCESVCKRGLAVQGSKGVGLCYVSERAGFRHPVFRSTLNSSFLIPAVSPPPDGPRGPRAPLLGTGGDLKQVPNGADSLGREKLSRGGRRCGWTSLS